jgi:hypothetical protein
MTFAGSNRDYFSVLEDTTVLIDGKEHHLRPTGERIYLNYQSKSPGPVPASWPKMPNSTARAAISIRPDPVAVNKGQLDSALIKFLTSAPASGGRWLLGLWHEASVQDYPIEASDLRQAQSHVQALAHQHAPHVLVGAIDEARISAKNARKWMAKNLDFYCCDLYDTKAFDAVPSQILDDFRKYSDALMETGKARIGVTETNTGSPKRRPYWFTHAWSWLQSNGFTSDESCFLTYWNPVGAYSGPWLPKDTATIKALYPIFEKSAP